MDKNIKKMTPKISIIICSYNRAQYIEKAIRSILDQTFTNFEIIVIDDASEDNTENIVRDLTQKDQRIKYFKNENNLGISKSRNKGVSLAQGEYIAMLDSDDYWIDNNKLLKQVDILEEDKNIGLIGSDVLCVDQNGKELKKHYYKSRDSDIRKKILCKNQFAQSSVVFRKKIFNEVGKYNESLDVCEDLDLWLKIGKKNKFQNLNKITTAYMVHQGGISKQRKLKIATNIDKIITENKQLYPNYFWAKTISIIRILKAWI